MADARQYFSPLFSFPSTKLFYDLCALWLRSHGKFGAVLASGPPRMLFYLSQSGIQFRLGEWAPLRAQEAEGQSSGEIGWGLSPQVVAVKLRERLYGKKRSR